MNSRFRKSLSSIIALASITLINAQINSDFTKRTDLDTIKGNTISKFIKPKNPVINHSFSEVDLAPTFKRKCRKKITNEERAKCFGDVFFKIIRKKIRIPNDMIKDRPITIVTKFHISKIGKIENVEFLSSNDYTGKLEKNIIRILTKMPLLQPAILNGIPTRVNYSFPLKMDLD